MSPGHCLCTLLYVNCCLLPIIMHGLLFALWFMSPESKATHSMVYKNALWFMSHGRSLLDKIALCTLVYVTLLKPMAGGVLLPHPSISSSLCNQPGLHCTIIAHRVATFRYLLHQTSCVQVQGLKGLKVRVIVEQQ